MKQIIALLGLLALFSCQNEESAGPISLGALEAKFIYLEGEVKVFDAPAELDMRIPKGALIETETDGYAEIQISTGNVVRLEPDTTLIWNFHLETPQLDLRTGSLSAVLQNLPASDSGERLKLVTPTTVAGVRGTSFFTKVMDGAETTYFCLCNGELALEHGDDTTEVEAAEHAAYTFTRRGGTIIQEKAELLYHDNESMNALASKINRVIDWSEAHKY
jgi:hypothetical protein